MSDYGVTYTAHRPVSSGSQQFTKDLQRILAEIHTHTHAHTHTHIMISL